MQQRSFWVVFVVYFSFDYECEAKQQISRNDVPIIISQLLGKDAKKPIVVYLQTLETDTKSKSRTFDDTELRNSGFDDDDDDDDNSFNFSQDDERAYIMYHLLRTTLDDNDVDPSAVENLELTTQALRQALIGRCRKLNSCKKKCPKPIKASSNSCTNKCERIYDDLNACDEPKKCRQPKCGKTMPPSWLL